MSAPAKASPAVAAPETPEQKADREFAAERARRETLRAAQNAHARDRKLAKLARKDPAIRDLLEQFRAMDGTIETLRRDLTAEREQLAEARAVIGEAHKDLADLRVVLDATRADLAAAREQLAKERSALDAESQAHAEERAKLRAELTAALKAKK